MPVVFDTSLSHRLLEAAAINPEVTILRARDRYNWSSRTVSSRALASLNYGGGEVAVCGGTIQEGMEKVISEQEDIRIFAKRGSLCEMNAGSEELQVQL